MLLYFLLLLAMVKEGISTYRPSLESPCVMENMAALCQNKSFHQIPMGLHPNIKILDMSKNELQNITESPLFLYSLIEYLDLSANKISFIQHDSFKNMVNLKEINMSVNYLDGFAHYNGQGIGILPHVQTLDLSINSLYNDMTRPFLQNAPHLQHLLLSGNSITVLSSKTFEGAPKLKEVDLQNNIIMHIEEGTFDHLKHLTKINLAMNSISCISDFKLQQLKSLNLSKNSIEMFHTSDSDEEYMLEHVDLSDNKLLNVPILPRINNIATLNLSMNLISLSVEMSDDETSWMDDTVQLRSEDEGELRNTTTIFLPKLTYLDLSYNNIESIPNDFFVSMPLLRFLNLSKNCLEDVSFGYFVPQNSLVVLDLSGNSLQNISLAKKSLRGLQELYLQNNRLHVIESKIFQGLPSIVLLNLQNNNINLCPTNSGVMTRRTEEYRCVAFFNIPTLQHLNLRENMMQKIPQSAFNGTPLTYLDLSLNFGLTITPNALEGLERSLEVLYIEGNGLQLLNVDLPLFMYLKDLNLSGNQLTWLPSWNKYCKLETLDLSNNSFSDLQHSNIQGLENTLKTLCLYGNPLSCCANSWIAHMVRRTTLTVLSLNSTTCYSSNSNKEEILIEQLIPEICEKEELTKINLIVIILSVIAIVLVIAIGCGIVCRFCRRKSKQQFKA
ncbi:leucine-rich repeat-containing 32 [Pelobates cultripes]|uniref:Leucine-rich repeat-containing 32 n=1 Tax=Pelobates cultripes TaxID=61616 RepID=A0AAD1R8S5_PELCU|nr:leucine-rich repeat-containing 32 [Pelobates cultripes]